MTCDVAEKAIGAALIAVLILAFLFFLFKQRG